MAKTPPERLAAALRANLKRRKAAPAVAGELPTPARPAQDQVQPVEKPLSKPPVKG